VARSVKKVGQHCSRPLAKSVGQKRERRQKGKGRGRKEWGGVGATLGMIAFWR